MGACGADSAARGRWQPFESSGQRWAAAHAFVAQPVYAAITTQSDTPPCLIERPMRCDGMVEGGGGGGVGVFQPGRLHLMRVMQQASWWVFPQNSCRHNFSHLINELGTLQQIQWHGPAPPPAPSPPLADLTHFRNTFRTTRWKVGGRRASPRSRGPRQKKTNKKRKMRSTCMSGSRCLVGFARAAAGGCKAALTTRPPLVHYCVRSPPPGRRNVEELEKKNHSFCSSLT